MTDVDAQRATAIDLFAGCGGATTGLMQAGFVVLAAVENDPTAAATLRENYPGVNVIEQDIRSVNANDLRRRMLLEAGGLTLLKACPPCQGYSSRGTADPTDERNELVNEVWRFVQSFRPRSVLLENVPGLGRDERLGKLERQLRGAGYRPRRIVLDAARCGVPQRRRRLIVAAVRSPSSIPKAPEDWLDLSEPAPASAVFAIAAAIDDDPLARHRRSGPSVQARIEAVPPGGSRSDLPEPLQLECHKRLAALGRVVATESYGRIDPGLPAPTMTTKCTTPSSGRFIHPIENRGITLREAALFQGFPLTYRFKGGHDAIERQIGNAIPVGMARALGTGLMRQIDGHE